MSKLDELIKKFEAIKEELNKGINMSYSPQPNSPGAPAPTPTTGTSGGQGGMYRSEDVKKDGMIGQDAMMVKFDKNGQWSLDKAVREPLIQPSNFKDTKPAKYQGGDPRHSLGTDEPLRGPKRKTGEQRPDAAGMDLKGANQPKGKLRGFTSGTSALRFKKDEETEILKTDKNGQWSLDKVDPTENINVPHPQGKAKMANGVNKEEMSEKLGTNQRLANPPEGAVGDPRGKKVHMIKDEGKFKVMDEVEEKESKKEKVAGLPYNGDDKKTHKSESADAKGYEEQRAQNKARFTYST